MKRFFKYIILLALAFIGIYNLIGFFEQSSMTPLYFAMEAFLSLIHISEPTRRS